MPTATADWQLWSTTARIIVTRAAELGEARAIAESILAAVDAACSRFNPDSELARIAPALDRGAEVSPLLAMLVSRALQAAELTDGDVDPTLGRALDAVGYDRDIRLVEDSDSILHAIAAPRPGWRSARLEGSRLRLPAGLSFDLGATAKAVAADLVAEAVFRQTGSGVLVSLGGDIATAGPGPVGGWTVLVQDLDSDPAAVVRLVDGSALATSSTRHRRWRRGDREVHHVLDPRTGLPALAVWRTVSVCAPSCLLANAMTTASIVRGATAPAWLASRGVAARLVGEDDRVLAIGGWPAGAEAPRGMEPACDV